MKIINILHLRCSVLVFFNLKPFDSTICLHIFSLSLITSCISLIILHRLCPTYCYFINYVSFNLSLIAFLIQLMIMSHILFMSPQLLQTSKPTNFSPSFEKGQKLRPSHLKGLLPSIPYNLQVYHQKPLLDSNILTWNNLAILTKISITLLKK